MPSAQNLPGRRQRELQLRCHGQPRRDGELPTTGIVGSVGDATAPGQVPDATPERGPPVTPCEAAPAPRVGVEAAGPVGIAVDATTCTGQTTSAALVMKCALGGCNDSPSRAHLEHNPIEVVADGTNVYFTDDVDD